jgi:hypothetical protein
MLGYMPSVRISAENEGAILAQTPEPRVPEPVKIPVEARIASYKIVVENLERFAARRQSANNVFVTLNSVFLTAIGVFISTHLSSLNSWSGTIALLVIAIAITPLNALWLFALNRYVRGDQARYAYLEALEEGFPKEIGVGLYHTLRENKQHPSFLPRPEQYVAVYFTVFYVVIVIAAALLALLIQLAVLPAVRFPG